MIDFTTCTVFQLYIVEHPHHSTCPIGSDIQPGTKLFHLLKSLLCRIAPDIRVDIPPKINTDRKNKSDPGRYLDSCNVILV